MKVAGLRPECVEVECGCSSSTVKEPTRMFSDENKALIPRYIQAIDDNDTSDWSVVDDYIAEDFVAHNPPIPGVRDRAAGRGG
jgi:hypothetical protein